MAYPKVEIAQNHRALLDDIRQTEMAAGRAAFWWLGQHSFIVKIGTQTGAHILYIDPYFDPIEARQTPPLLEFAEPDNADLVLVTHDHSDHLCPVSLSHIAAQCPQAQFVSPRTATRRMTEDAHVSADRLHTLSAAESLEWNGLRITAIKGKHESFDEDPVLGFPWLGYVVETLGTDGKPTGFCFYHAGDTIAYEGLQTTLAQWSRFDVMFLPINGRDGERFRRNCMGNLTFQESAELAGELKPGLAVPTHYDMFIGNQEDPAKFVDFLNAKFPGVSSWVGKAGEKVWFSK